MEEEATSAPAPEAGAESVREEAGGAAAEARLADAERRAEEAGRRAEDLLAQLQRMKADFDNYRRRMTQEQARWQDGAVARFVAELLPVIDNLERGLGSAAGTAETDALRQGFELVVRQLHEVLERHGVRPLEAVGVPFDPERHEAMARVEEGDRAEDTVVEEFRKGYLYKGSVLRPALVKVAVGTRNRT